MTKQAVPEQTKSKPEKPRRRCCICERLKDEERIRKAQNNTRKKPCESDVLGDE